MLCASDFVDDVMFASNSQEQPTRQNRTCMLKSDSPDGSADLTSWHILKLNHQGAALDQGQSLISTIALLPPDRISKCVRCDL